MRLPFSDRFPFFHTALQTTLGLSLALTLLACTGGGKAIKSRLSDSPPPSDLNIQNLINGTPDGGVVRIPKATYLLTEGLVVQDRHGLTIECEPGAKILVDDISADVLEVTNSSDITIRGAFLRHKKPLPKYECHGDVLKLRGSRNIRIFNSELDGCGAIGVSVWQSSAVLVKHCLIRHNSFNALYFEGSNEIQVVHCIIRDNANLLQAYRCQSIQMAGNVMENNGGYWEEPGVPGLTE